MTDIIKLLPTEAQKEFFDYMYAELPTIETEFGKEKIAELNATNILLVEYEQELRELKAEQEYKMLNLKNSTTYEKSYKTLKQREEKAKLETNDYNAKILEKEKEVQILKANKQGLELEIKLLLKNYLKWWE